MEVSDLPACLLSQMVEGILDFHTAKLIAEHPDLVTQIEAETISCDTAILEVNARSQRRVSL